MKVNAKQYNQGEILKFMRQALGLTQRELAESIGKKESWLSDIEQGRNNYYFKDLLEIAKKYNFDVTIEKK